MDNWADHPEGKQCKQRIDALLKKINTNTDNLMKDWDKETMGVLRSTEINKKTLFKLIKKNKY